jgi:hypothetical protein
MLYVKVHWTRNVCVFAGGLRWRFTKHQHKNTSLCQLYIPVVCCLYCSQKNAKTGVTSCFLKMADKAATCSYWQLNVLTIWICVICWLHFRTDSSILWRMRYKINPIFINLHPKCAQKRVPVCWVRRCPIMCVCCVRRCPIMCVRCVRRCPTLRMSVVSVVVRRYVCLLCPSLSDNVCLLCPSLPDIVCLLCPSSDTVCLSCP